MAARVQGEVYRADDTKLKREVAIKVLPEHFALDKERMARFEREAQVLAALNHPNIAAIYGLERGNDGRHLLVMELVPGESLQQRLARGPLSAEESIEIAKQIALALESAHEKGIVHRDLKPGNVQITADGIVKVLDFGLAKAVAGDTPDADTSLSPTVSRDGSRAGVILGTASYMSPEQARGRSVDKRADIFSFGCVLFEMLTGRKAFEGELVSDILAAVIKSDPPWDALPADTSPALRKLLARTLEKDPKTRLRDIGDVRFELDEASTHPTVVVDVSRPENDRRAWAIGTAAALAACALTALLVWNVKPNPTRDAAVTRFSVSVPIETEAFSAGVRRRLLALSPDGRSLVHSSGGSLYLRRMGELETSPVRGTEGRGVGGPFFSPDGRWVGFWVTGQLKKVPLAGGAPVTLCDLRTPPHGASWEENGTILFGARGGIWQVSDAGGQPELLIELDDNAYGLTPRMLPGGEAFVFGKFTAETDKVSLQAGRFSSGETVELVANGFDASYLPTGHLIFASENTLMAAPFDPHRLTLLAEPLSIVEDVSAVVLFTQFGNFSGLSQYAVSATGTLVHLSTGELTIYRTTVVSVGPEGTTLPQGEPRWHSDVRLSPNGERVALHVRDDLDDIWVYDLSRGAMTRLTFEPGEDETPVWSPDGRFIAYRSTSSLLARGAGGGGSVVVRTASDGSGTEEALWEREHHVHVSDWTPDGRSLLVEVRAEADFDVMLLELDSGEPEPRPLLDSRFQERSPRISPDGRWIAYTSDESGRDEVYLQRFPELGDKRSVSTDGGVQPVWSRDGETLYYRGSRSIMSVAISHREPYQVGAPEALFPDDFVRGQGLGHTSYDVAPDGRLFLLQALSASGDGSVDSIQFQVALDWFEELEERVPLP